MMAWARSISRIQALHFYIASDKSICKINVNNPFLTCHHCYPCASLPDGRKRFVHEAAKGASLGKKAEEDDDKKARIHFCKAASSSQKPGQTSGTDGQRAPPSQKKRKREASCPAPHSGPPAKQKVVPLTVEDWNLLNSY